MHFEGSHTFSASREVLWQLLNDPQVLARATPGVKELKPAGRDQYRALFDIKLGPINSSFSGTLKVVDKQAPSGYRLLIDVDGKIGHIKAEGRVALEGDGQSTLLKVQGGSQLSGTLARLGQRLLSGVARMFTNQFFKALEREIP
jgi:carbon monoxide dehydrogenase subunit G